MGLFSSKKIINVSSTLYNMAGPEDERPNYLKGTLFSSTMAGSSSLADDITRSYFNGPGLKQRSFFRYADRNDIAGLPTATVTNNASADPDVVAGEIPLNGSAPAGAYITVTNSQISEGDPTPFLERWILQNHQERISEDWLGDYEPSTDSFSVQFPNGDYFTFTDSQYNPDGRYIEARYIHVIDDDTQPEVLGTPTTVTSQVPDLVSFTPVSSDGIVFSTTLVRTADITEEYSDSTPTNNYQQDASVSADLNRSTDVYEKTDLIANVGLQIEGEYQRLTYIGDDQKVNTYSDTTVVVEDIGGGVTRTTTTVTTGEEVQVQWTEQLDTQDIFESTVLYGEELFIYTFGSGNATLDALFQESDASNFQEFFPFLPLRLNNNSVAEGAYVSNGLYSETAKAYKRATSPKDSIDAILDQIENNDSIDDIDYAYIMYGVSLNVEENSCRKYIFRYFENMIPFQNSGSGTMAGFTQSIADYNAAKTALDAWKDTDWDNTPWDMRPPRPVIPALSIPEQTTIRLKTNSTLMPSFDMRLQWSHIDLEQFNGVYTYEDPLGGNRNARKNEVQIQKGSTVTWQEEEGVLWGRSDDILGSTRLIDKSLDSIEIYWQIDDNTYRRLTIYGLLHSNYIYRGKAVRITGHEALDDTDISGFIIPLHEPTMRSLSIVDYTQMATANVHILFNSYTVTKQKWYQRGFFKILLIIIIIVVAITINPGAFAAGSGILGANAAIGATLGLTGTAAIVAGAIANYLASVIVAEVLKVVGTELFGEKFGALFAAIAGLAIGAVASGGFVFDAAGVLKIGGALANGYAGFVADEIDELSGDFEKEQNSYEEQMEYINDLIAGLGGNDLQFNPLFLTDSVQGNGGSRGSGGYLPETADQFIRRTTMTGSDVVDITYSMVYDFVEVQQTLPRN